MGSMELTDMAVLDMDMVLDTEPTDMPDIHMSMERDLPMLSQRLMLMLLSSMELTDMLDTHMLMVPMDTMERDPLMLSQRPMLMLLSSMELTDMLDTHMLDTLMDTHMPMVPTDTMERDPLMLSQRLMLVCIMVDTTDMPDLMPMDTEPMDTHTGDKSQTHFKDSTKQKLKANNIQL